MEKPDIKNGKYRDEKGNFNSGLWSDDKTLYIYDLESEVQRLRKGLLFAKDYPTTTMGLAQCIKDILK